ARMRVVELKRRFLREQAPVRVMHPKAANDIRQGAGHQKIFLNQAKSLAQAGRVIGIEHAGQRFRLERLGYRADELAVTEGLEVEIFGRAGGPQAQRVDGPAAVPHDRAIVGNADQARGFAGYRSQSALAHLERAIEVNVHLITHAADFPGITARQPVIRPFDLHSFTDALLDNAALLPEPLAYAWNLH